MSLSERASSRLYLLQYAQTLAFCTYSEQHMPCIVRIQMSGQDLYVIKVNVKTKSIHAWLRRRRVDCPVRRLKQTDGVRSRIRTAVFGDATRQLHCRVG